MADTLKDDIETARMFLEWLDTQPLHMEREIEACRRLVSRLEDAHRLIHQAVLRVEIANKEGDAVLSAWAPHASLWLHA